MWYNTKVVHWIYIVRQFGIWLFYPSGKYQGHLHKVPKQEQRLSVDYDTLQIILQDEINFQNPFTFIGTEKRWFWYSNHCFKEQTEERQYSCVQYRHESAASFEIGEITKVQKIKTCLQKREASV